MCVYVYIYIDNILYVPSASKNMSPMAEPQALGLFWWLLLEALAENEGCSMRVKACEKPKDAIILIYMYIYIYTSKHVIF